MSTQLDQSSEALGDYTCSCPLSECAWTSWAEDENSRNQKERTHAFAEHPEEAHHAYA